MKHCTGCTQDKPLTEFHDRTASPDGKCHRCIECKKRYRKGYREHENKRNRKRRKLDPEWRDKQNAYTKDWKLRQIKNVIEL